MHLCKIQTENYLIDWFSAALCHIQEHFTHISQGRTVKWKLLLGDDRFDEGGIFIVPHLLWHENSVFLRSSEGLYKSPCGTSKGWWERSMLNVLTRIPIGLKSCYNLSSGIYMYHIKSNVIIKWPIYSINLLCAFWYNY